jgi:hypothetical protein
VIVKVLILGAGASRAAGYPLASELMTAIERDAVDSKNLQLADAWKGWLSIKNDAPPELRILLSHPNPEVALSLLDLCRICFKDGLVERFSEDNRPEAVTEALSRNEIREDLYLSTAHAWLDKAGTAVFRLVDSLSDYLEFKQHADIESASSRAYLRDLFSALSKGDVVITLNWDASADRSLFEIKRWSPRDGYGFEKRLVCAFSSNPLDLPARIIAPSEILLLKLHGSVGWRARDENHLVFDTDFLQTLVTDDLVAEIVQDADAAHYEDGRPLIAHPSYLKTAQNKFLREIWRRADLAIRSADSVDIWGYSLPESDIAVSLLLAPLRWRAARNEIAVCVHNPSGEALDRYRSFFDGRVSLDKKVLG